MPVNGCSINFTTINLGCDAPDPVLSKSHSSNVTENFYRNERMWDALDELDEREEELKLKKFSITVSGYGKTGTIESKINLEPHLERIHIDGMSKNSPTKKH